MPSYFTEEKEEGQRSHGPEGISRKRQGRKVKPWLLATVQTDGPSTLVPGVGFFICKMKRVQGAFKNFMVSTEPRHKATQ